MEKFLKILTEDEKVRADFLDQNTREGAYKVAKPYIDEMTIDEFTDNLSGLVRAFDKLQAGELDESDLNAVSGGVSLNLLSYADSARMSAALKRMIKF